MKNQATEIAKLLLEIKAVSLNLKQPYRYTSGILSPIYCDNRLIISYPNKRNTIINAFLSIIENAHLKFDVVAGVATAGIAHAAWIADRLAKPLVYVRDKAKSHGQQNQIEGRCEKGQQALIIEDLISTGGSVIKSGLALREAGLLVNSCVAIFSYELAMAKKALEAAKITAHTLTNFSTLLNVATQKNIISESEKVKAMEWRENPEQWK